MTVHLFIYSTGSRIQQYSIEGAAVSRVQCKCLVRFLVAYQFPCDYAGLGFSPYAILWRHAQHHLPNYGREQCLLQSEPTANTQIAICRRISGGHIAQVALLPLKAWGGGPPGPWEIPCPGPRKETCFSSIFKQPKIVLLLIKFKNLSSSDFFYRYHNHTIFKSFL